MNNTSSTHKNSYLDSTQAQALQERLQDELADTPWQSILEAFTITGVLDSEQMQSVCSLQRMQLTRLLDKMESYRNGLPPILHKLDQSIRRPGVRGRAPNVYLLGESGAGLLRLLGHEDVQACRLNSETAITHALGMVDVHLAAVRASVSILTDHTLAYGEQGILRPDHQLSGSKTRILEVEQSAAPDTLRRLVTSLEHKQAFFTSIEGSQVESKVLMLIQLPRGPVWERTLKTWRTAIELCMEKLGGQFAFKIRVLPLQDFLRQPDWDGSQRMDWIDLSNPQLGTSIQKTLVSSPAKSQAPSGLMYRTTRQDQLVLAALWQDFKSLSTRDAERFPMASPDFLQLVRLIYRASFGFRTTVFESASLPYAALYLLQQYLKMHPALHERLTKVMHFGRGSLRWNSVTILHRMQVVINTFLGYHGWRPDGPLLAYPQNPAWDDEGPRTFGVIVQIHDEALLMQSGDNVHPLKDQVREHEQALEWVLFALFNYAHELGLGRVEFW